MSDLTKKLRDIIASLRRDKDVDPDRTIPALVEFFGDESVEITFVEEQLVAPSLVAAVEQMTVDEKEVFFECLQSLIRDLKDRNAGNMN